MFSVVGNEVMLIDIGKKKEWIEKVWSSTHSF